MHQAKAYFDLLNNAKFRRAKPYPGDEEMAIQRIEHSLQAGEPILLMMYWARAERDYLAEPEQRSIVYLAENLAKVSEMYAAGVTVDVVFADTHVKFNGYEIDAGCLAQVQNAFDSVFAAKANLRARTSFSSDYLPFKSTMDGKAFEEFALLKARAATSDIAPELRALLAGRSMRYYHRTKDTPGDVASMYYELCKLEQEPIGRAFSQHIFLTYNAASASGKKHFGVPACMPALCVNSLPGSLTDKPWNMELDKLQNLSETIYGFHSGYKASIRENAAKLA